MRRIQQLLLVCLVGLALAPAGEASAAQVTFTEIMLIAQHNPPAMLPSGQSSGLPAGGIGSLGGGQPQVLGAPKAVPPPTTSGQGPTVSSGVAKPPAPVAPGAGAKPPALGSGS